MSIRSRIHLFQLIIGLSVLVMAAVVYVTVRWTEYHVKRMEWANRQLEAITAVRVSANRFSEQIAEFLLIGEPERADFEGAKAELEGDFKRLEEATRGEFTFLAVHERREEGTDEFFRIERMRALYNEINQAAERVFGLRDAGRQEEAISVFRRDIENRLDAELEHLLTAATLDEKEEVERRAREAAELWRWLTWITAAATAMAIGVCLISGLLLARALQRPIKLLTEGAQAIGRGELDHRIRYEGRNELGALAQRFNEMAAMQETQLALVRQAQTSLEGQVVERTKELAAANKRLTDLDRLRVQFLADISHELRTPLTALRGEAEIAVRHGSKPEAVYRETLKRIVAQSEDMARLVDDLLFLARSETDTIRFEPCRVLLNELVRDAVTEGSVVGQVKNIAVQADYAHDPVWVMADPHRMRQALMILLDNAIKYSPPDRTVSVCMKAMDGYGEVAVRDQGVGIPAEELPHVFERFYRGRISSISGRGGSGLGLAIAKWIVDKHGGEIALTSDVGRYTEVRVRIPQRG
jgi:two-component system OmpR family sensor kinase